MKNVIAKIFLVAVAFTGLNVAAMSPVDPNGLPTIELRMGGGMPVPGGLGSRTLTVYRSGEVLVRETRYPKNFGSNDRPENIVYTLAYMDPREMFEIGQAVETLKGGPLTKAKGPECMDAPGYQYTVYKSGSPVTIFRRASCRDQQLADRAQRASANAIKNFLDQLNQLAH